MPGTDKPILVELIAILNLPEFESYFKGTWELWSDDKVAYNFDNEKYLPLEILDVYEFMKNFIALINKRLKCEIWFAFQKETSVFDFDINAADAEKVPGLHYGHIKKFINQIIKKPRVEQSVVEFLEALSQHCHLTNSKFHFSVNLKNKLSKEFLIKIQIYSCSIVTVNDSNDVEIYIQEKTREIEIFLRRMKNGITSFRLFSENLPASFIDFDESSQRILLKFSDLQLFVEKCPGFNISDCLSNSHLSLNLPDLKQQRSLISKKSESWSPKLKSNLPEEAQKIRDRSESAPGQNLKAKGKALWKFFTGNLFHKSNANSTSSDEEQKEYSATNSNS